MKTKVSNHPHIFRASDVSRLPKFPFDNKVEDDWADYEICPSCNIRFSDHSPRQIVKCAIAELRGEKKN